MTWMRRNVIVRRTDAMRRLSDCDRRTAIGEARNVIGYGRFHVFTARVRRVEADLAVSISNPR